MIDKDKLEELMGHASRDGTYYYTRNRLYGEYRLQAGSVGCGTLVAFVSLTLMALLFVGLSVLVAAGLLATALWVLYSASKKLKAQKLSRASFDQAVEALRADGLVLERCIETPSLGTPPPEFSEPDLQDYGVERILVLERDLLVDYFVLNQFHAGQNALVISESGYPSYLVDRARSLLAESPDLPVFLLHDSTHEGLGMEARLRSSGTLPLDGRQVYDLGLTPEHVRQLEGLDGLDAKASGYQIALDSLPYPPLVDRLSETFGGASEGGEVDLSGWLMAAAVVSASSGRRSSSSGWGSYYG